MKNYFFATSLVLVLVSLSGCDDPGDQVVSGEAGAPPVFPPGEPHCQVPAPKFPHPGLSTTPSSYQWLANYPGGFVCSAIPDDSYGVPTNCSDPVDGFSDGKLQKYVDPFSGKAEEVDVWCCVVVVATSDSKYVYATAPSLVCGNPQDLVARNSALCSASGVFVGWKC